MSTDTTNPAILGSPIQEREVGSPGSLSWRTTARAQPTRYFSGPVAGAPEPSILERREDSETMSPKYAQM